MNMDFNFLRTTLLVIISLNLLNSCKKTETPEDVYRKYLIAQSECDKETLLSITTGQSLVDIKFMQEPCEPYKEEICQLTCGSETDTAICIASVKRNNVEMTFKNELRKINGEWKVAFGYKTFSIPFKNED